MLEELTEAHSPMIDFIHNLICDNLDDEVGTSILKEGKSIQSALNFALDVLSKNSERRGNVGVIGGDDKDLFGIIRQYYIGDQTKVGHNGSYRASTSKTNEDSEKPEKLEKKTGTSVQTILDSNLEDAEKVKQIQQILRVATGEKQVKQKITDEQQLTSIFDFMEDDSKIGENADESDGSDEEADD
ncbi:MAG: hypothetical protein WBL80_02850 [Erysipelotrichaceae bacterium]